MTPTRVIPVVTGSCYIRVSLDSVPVLEDSLSDGLPFGGAKMIRNDGDAFAVVYEGTALAQARDGFDRLADKGLRGRLVQVQTVKPFPEKDLMAMIRDVQKIVTVENHTVISGLGGAVSEMLAAYPVHPPLVRIGVQDEFTQSGPTALVKERYGLSGRHVALAILEP